MKRLILLLFCSTAIGQTDYVFFPQGDIVFYERRVEVGTFGLFSATEPLTYDGGGVFGLSYEPNDFSVVAGVLIIDYNDIFKGFFTSGSIIYADTDGTLTETNPGFTWLSGILGLTGDLTMTGDLSVTGTVSVKNGNEVRFNDIGNSNYVGFEAPILSANQIWQLPDADGQPGSVLATNGFGSLNWAAGASEKAWAFMSRDASSGTNYIGGYYKFQTSDNDFNPSVTFGTANASYAAHFFLVQAAGASGGTDTVIRVTGTTIDDQGTRTTGVDVDITVDDAGAAGVYYETTEKWLGQVTIEKQSGPDLLCNYGYCKYWDNNNTAFRVIGMEATWLGAKNDNTPDIKLRHHKADGWTYNNAAVPTPPTEIASMATDHDTEILIRTAEEGAWKRDNLSTNIAGDSGEGTIIELATTTNRTYAIGNFMLRISAGVSEDVIFNGENVIFNGEQVVYP